MTSEVEAFEARGVRFETVTGVTAVYGPEGDEALLGELREAVARRIERYGTRRPTKRRSDGCVFCGDEMAVGRSGDCALCRIAGQKKRSVK